MSKNLIILVLVAVSFFALGWFMNDMSDFAEGLVADAKRLDSLKILQKDTIIFPHANLPQR
jgi:hypothetical protein